MSKSWNILGFALLLSLTMAAGVSDTPSRTGEIWGKITDAKSGEVLNGIQVVLPEARIGGLTNQEGLFFLRNIPLGATTLRLEHPCFHSVTVEVEMRADIPQRQVSVGMPYDLETEAQTGCDRRIRNEMEGDS